MRPAVVHALERYDRGWAKDSPFCFTHTCMSFCSCPQNSSPIFLPAMAANELISLCRKMLHMTEEKAPAHPVLPPAVFSPSLLASYVPVYLHCCLAL